MNKKTIKTIVEIGEIFFAFLVFATVIYFSFTSGLELIQMDWNSIETFYELINRVLILVVGLELTKLLVTHDLYSIADLLAFVVARKVLRPELTSMDILLAVLAFSVLFVIKVKFNKQEGQ